jgi:hypothetical protein
MRASLQAFHRCVTVAELLWIVGLVMASLGACAVDDRKVQTLPPAPLLGSIVPCGSACPEVECPADDACRDYDDRIEAGNCNGSGSCAGPGDCSFTWRPAARDGAACACGAAGCQLLDGEACTMPSACASGNCLATNAGGSVCCDAACSESEACTADGTGCEPAQPCTEGDRRCTSAAYQQCSQQRWVTISECGVFGCNRERGGCLHSAGQACAANEDCGEGSCVETPEGARVCCTASCDAECQRCAPTGVECANLEDDAACGVITCPIDDPCRLYVGTVESQRCVEGRCATPEEACTFTPRDARLECNPSTLCDDAGNCSVAKLAANAPCGVGAECLSGACVASEAGGSVCCSSACAPNEWCGLGGDCVLAPVCEDGATQCSGSTFQRCSGGQWGVVTECGALGCDELRGGCLAGAGDACGSDDDCGAGSCQATAAGGRVCCTAACGGACRRCAATGLSCENLPDDAACGAIACPADSSCRDFPQSVTAQRCVDGRCGSAAQLCSARPQGENQPCSPTNLCDAAGNCNRPRLDAGDACTSNAQCASNSCIDGICCNEACSGECRTCASGVCQVRNAPECDGTDVECNGSVCEVGAVTSEVCCASFGQAARCIGAASCPAPPNIPTTCDDHLDCDPGRCCRVQTDNPSMVIECRPAADCAQPPTPALTIQQLCGSPFQPMTVVRCPAGQTCVASPDSRLVGWSFCQ